MERRTISNRRPRRTRVQFWKRGETEPTIGFTSNVSNSGLFVVTNNPLPRGARLRVEVTDPPGLFVECVVAHAIKVAPGLQRVRQSGMGLRFLRGDELLADLLAPAPPPPKPVAPVASVPLPEPVAPAMAAVPGPPKDKVYSVRYSDNKSFIDSFRRDFRNGGVFVETKFPAALNEEVTIEVVPPAGNAKAVRLQGIVTSIRSSDGAAPTTEKPGMGVLFDDPQEVVSLLLPAVAEAQGS